MVALCEDVSVGLDVDLKELARPSYTDNFTGADLKALLFNAQLKLAHEMLDQKRSRRDSLSFLATPPHSLESSPEIAVKAGACMGATTFSYESVTGIRKHSVLPEDVAEKVWASRLCVYWHCVLMCVQHALAYFCMHNCPLHDQSKVFFFFLSLKTAYFGGGRERFSLSFICGVCSK